MNVSFRLTVSAVLCLFLSSCFSVKTRVTDSGKSVSNLKFLGEFVLPHNLKYDSTITGGLSGIDYDREHDRYYMICDDRSEINPARFYTAQIKISGYAIESVKISGVSFLQQQNGTLYPDRKLNTKYTADPEAIRYNPLSRQLIWSSEGDRVVKPDDTILINPSLTMVSTEGKYIDTLLLPPNLFMHSYEKGPRRNGVLEGLAFSDNYTSLYTNVEEPLYEDGPRADLKEDKAYIRLFKFDLKSRKNTAQYAYLLEPIPYAPVSADGEKMNGVSDILSVNNHQFLITERSYSEGRLGCIVRVFLADITKADNIMDVPSLKTAAFRPAEKKLLLNMEHLGIYIDNIEGATFGPTLPNGHRSVIFVADNNFNAAEKSQFLLFEAIP